MVRSVLKPGLPGTANGKKAHGAASVLSAGLYSVTHVDKDVDVGADAIADVCQSEVVLMRRTNGNRRE
jgi:hypothetical protein